MASVDIRFQMKKERVYANSIQGGKRMELNIREVALLKSLARINVKDEEDTFHGVQRDFEVRQLITKLSDEEERLNQLCTPTRPSGERY